MVTGTEVIVPQSHPAPGVARRAAVRRRAPLPGRLPLRLAACLALQLTVGLVASPLRAQGPAPKLSDDPRVKLVQIPGSVPAPRPAAIVLPVGYDTGSRRYPVLYLLHGLDGSWQDWLSRTNLLAYTAHLPAIVVLPDAGNSWYVNSATDTTQRFEHYIGTDVVAYVDAHFRTLPYPQARYIAGLSMGGYGALLLATKAPGRFSFAASLSGAFTPIRDWDHPSVMAAFGPVGSAARDSADFARILKTADPRGLPYYWLGCGTSDPLIGGSREIAAILSERKLPYEYHETAGAHEWAYWDRSLPAVLQQVRQRIDLLNGGPPGRGMRRPGPHRPSMRRRGPPHPTP
jgi:putative tributyrin esterase